MNTSNLLEVTGPAGPQGRQEHRDLRAHKARQENMPQGSRESPARRTPGKTRIARPTGPGGGGLCNGRMLGTGGQL